MTLETEIPEAEPVLGVQTVEVHFKGNRRAFFTWDKPGEDRLRLREAVIVEASRGLDFGRVSKVGDHAAKASAGSCTSCSVGAKHAPEPSRPVVRRASQAEIATANQLRRDEESNRQATIEKVKGHKLDMRVSDTEWQWDRSKLTLYFTAEARVDFRGLVRDLASLFKTRIELRQIGVRDEAARLTGVGRCGREYCCSTWLKELTPVSLALAKDQNLSLNPSQISGGCGRLLCCLKYEHEFYAAQRRRFPKEGKMIRTAKGGEKVVAVDIFRERVFLRGEDGSRIIPLIELQEEQAQVALLPPDASASASPSAPQAQSPPRQESRREQPRRSDSTSRPNRPENRRPINPAEPPRAETPPAAAVVPPIEPVAPPAAAGDSSAAAKPDGTKGRRNRRRRRGRRPPDSAPGAPPENPGT